MATAIAPMPVDAQNVALAALRREYDRARVAAARAAIYGECNCPPGTCRYCGQRWDRHPRTKFDGHVRCVVTSEFLATFRAFSRTHWKIRTADVVAALDITAGCYRSWFDAKGSR